MVLLNGSKSHYGILTLILQEMITGIKHAPLVLRYLLTLHEQSDESLALTSNIFVE